MRQKAFETTFSTPGGKAQSGALSAKPRVVRGFGQLGIALSEFKVEVLAERQGFDDLVLYTVDFITFFRRAKSFYVATLWSIMPPPYWLFMAGRKKLALGASTFRCAKKGVQGHTDIAATALPASRAQGEVVH